MKIKLVIFFITTTIYILSLNHISEISLCSAASLNLDTGKLVNSFLQPFYNQLVLPKEQAYGRMNSTNAGGFRYPYIAFNNSIPMEAIPSLERHFSSIGYNPIGKNTSFKVDGKLIASCSINNRFSSKYSNSNFRIYKCIAECQLTDKKNNFIVYNGQGITYGSDADRLPVKSVILAFANLGVNTPVHSFTVSIKGLDDGIKTNRQTDDAEAVLNAKKQAIERAGVRLTIEKKHGRNYQYKNGKNNLEKYSRNEIESFASGVLAPGYIIQDHGYGSDGIYKITLKGQIIQDPTTAIKNHTVNFQKRGQILPPTVSDLLRNNKIQDVFEHKKSNLLFDFAHPSGTITFEIIKTFQLRSGENCRKARATFSWTPEISEFTACRNAYTRRWYVNQGL